MSGQIWSPYQVEIKANQRHVVTKEAISVTEARQTAEEYGQAADDALIYRCQKTDASKRVLVARHRRSPEGDGMRWYKATS